MYELINDVQIKIKEYKGQRVVTFKDIDTVHNRPVGTAKRNFNRNVKRFIEGEDFFKITPYEFRTALGGEMDLRQQNYIILLTESGYLMLVKSFTDDLSWSVQRQLVKTYFRFNIITVSENNMLLQIIENQKSLELKIDMIEKKINTLDKNSKIRTANIMETLFDMSSNVFAKGMEFIYNRLLK